MTQRYAWLTIPLVLASGLAGPASVRAQERPPLRLEQVTELVRSGVFPDVRILALADQSCLAFQLNEVTSRRLREAGASEDLVAGLREACVRLTVRVTPAQLDLTVAANEILEATAFDPDSLAVPDVFFDWSAEDSTVVELRDDGLVVARAPGETRIFASIDGGPSGYAVVRVVQPATASDSLSQVFGGKSVGTAAALGAIVPGGGEFYAGHTAKGVIVLGGAAAALAAGFLIDGKDTLSVSRDLLTPSTCQGPACDFDVEATLQIKETSYIVVGAAVAGAFWLYGLIDGMLAAKRSQPASIREITGERQGFSLRIVPPDGLRIRGQGEVELTLVRVRP